MLPPITDNGVVVVTGASSGIGEEIAREFARRGYRLVLVARRADRLTALAEELGGLAHVLPADLSNRDERATLFDQVAALGVVADILVNNAGLATLGPIAASSPEAELNLVEVDVAAVVDLCSRFVPSMVKRGRGAVLNVASVARSAPCPARRRTVRPRRSCCPIPRRCVKSCATPASPPPRCAPGPVYTGFLEAEGIPDEESEKALPKFLWQHADAVAKVAVDGMASGKGVIIPGLPNRIASSVNQHAPRRLLLPLIARNHSGLKKP
jgi:uncharacterized protein